MEAFKSILTILVIAISTFLSSCAKTTSLHESVVRADGPDLTKEYAAYRSSYIKNVGYDVHIDLASEADMYSGSNVITFDLAAVPSPGLTLDTGNKIDEFICNGKAAKFTGHRGFIAISSSCLKKGKNTLSTKYNGTYTSLNHGIKKYVDKSSGNTYIYTHFEPNYASTVIPLFDQPDIKASFSLTVDAPQNWIVVSAMPQSKTLSSSQSVKWIFEKTPPIPSYAFSIFAGPFQVFEDKSYSVPLRLIVRPEIASQINSDTIFKMTRQSFDFFTTYFNFPFPFPKYDQILLPNLSQGVSAMENAGATSIDEGVVLSALKLYTSQVNMGDIISHEIAHMWLGNLVTLKWWGDLWLNEGLAEYMSALQRADNSDFKRDIWNNFYAMRVRPAIEKDESTLSHSVKFDVLKVGDVESKFDGITYSKSAALLRQLSFRVGEKSFQKGLQTYIQHYAWKNADSGQFFEQIQQAAEIDLNSWVKSWYETSGLNEVTLSFSCEKNSQSGQVELRQVSVNQSNLGVSTFIREHTINAGLYFKENGKYALKSTKKFVFNGSSAKFDLSDATPCPDFINSNEDNIGYFKVRFDAKELELAVANVEQFDYPLRGRFWGSLWEQVEDGSLSIEHYINTVSDKLHFEPEGPSKTGLIRKLASANIYLSIFPGKKEKESALTASISDIIRRQYLEAKNPQFQSVIFGAYIGVSATKEDLAELNNILNSNYLAQKQTLDQSTRWQILRKLRQYGADKTGMVQQEEKSDMSPNGRNFFYSVDAVTNNLAIKRKWLNAIISESGVYSTPELQMVSGFLFPSNQMATYRALESEIFNLIEKGSADRKISAERLGLVANMIRSECTKEGIARLKSLDEKLSGQDSFARKALLNRIKTSEECLRVYDAL